MIQLVGLFLRAKYLHDEVYNRDDHNEGDNVLQRPKHELQQYQDHEDDDDNKKNVFHVASL
jgi:hypothetical protein